MCSAVESVVFSSDLYNGASEWQDEFVNFMFPQNLSIEHPAETEAKVNEQQMKINNPKYLILIFIPIVIIAVIFYNCDAIINVYMNVFHKSGALVHNGKGEKKSVIYENGVIVRKENFKNDILDGWRIDYNANGNIKSKSFYKNGKLDGIQFSYYDSGQVENKVSFKYGKHEGVKVSYYQNGQIKQSSFQKNDNLEGAEHAYYENGKLKFKGYWINNKFYGSQYIFYENGKVQIYHAYDILGDKFYLSHYDESEKLTQSDGYVFSSNIYSKGVGNDSLIVLKDNGIYDNIQDLYITVANPPHAHTGIKVIIDNKLKKIDIIDDNTVKIVNAFPNKGKYKIVLEGAFLDDSNIIIDDRDLIGKFIIIKK